jgi:CheY-like chemotaxis protein
MRIFICEQNQNRAKLIRDILGVYKYSVFTMNDELSLVNEAEDKRPSVIVINENFPGNENGSALRHLRSNPKTSGIPVIYIKNDQTEITGYDDGLTQFVREPIKIKNLRHYIDRWTTLKSLYVKN